MSHYARILQPFTHYGISSNDALEDFLRSNERSGAGSVPYMSPRFEGASLSRDVYSELSTIADQIDSLYRTSGIQQFSINHDTVISRENVLKALFLSRIATIFTPHKVTHSTNYYMVDDEGQEYVDESWEVSHDFVRALFDYREPIEAGQLVILPSSIRSIRSHSDSSTFGDDILNAESLLKMLDTTKVVRLGAEPELIDAIVTRYKRHHQLIVLPALSMPWVTNLSVPAMLQLKEDYDDSLDEFQRTYHEAIRTYIENHRVVDFESISRQINQDLIVPRVAKIEREYRRTVSHHRNLALAGVAVSFISIGAVIIGKALLNQILVGDLIPTITPAIASLVSAVATNKITQTRVREELEDDAFYVLWKLKPVS